MDIQKIRNLYNQKALLDNNILNDFYELDRMDLLLQVFSEIYIPESILSDETPQRIVSVLQDIEHKTTALYTEEGFALLIQLLLEWTGLSDYDAELVAIAKQDMILCTSNEKRIMNACESYGIEYTGSLGILCCAYEYHMIEKIELKRLVDKLFSDECSCHLNPRLRQPIYRQYGL